MGHPTVARAVTLLLAALAIVGCDGGSSPFDRKSQSRNAGPAKRTTTTSGGEVDTGGPSTPQRWLTDANVIALLRQANSRQTAAANIELERWHTGAVRDYAKSVLQDHSAMQRSVDSASHALNLAPIAPALAESLGAAGQHAVDVLSWRSASAGLENAYIRDQISSHTWLVSHLQQLSAVAEAPELRAVITMMSAHVKSHLQRAQQLSSIVAAADSLRLDSIASRDSARGHRAHRGDTVPDRLRRQSDTSAGVPPDTTAARRPARHGDTMSVRPDRTSDSVPTKPARPSDTSAARPPTRPPDSLVVSPRRPPDSASTSGATRRP